MSPDNTNSIEESTEATDEAFQLTDEQHDALDLSKNIAVTAGAGTGKTTTLTERYLRMLEPGKVSPANIVTITFTKDAANEMRERIRAAVDEELTAAGSQAIYDQWRTIRDELEDGYIHTIHAFCSRLLTEHAVEAPVDPAFSALDETDAAQLQREVVTQFIDTHQDDRDLKLLARLWSRDALEEVLVGLLDSRPESTQWANHWQDKTPDEYLDVTWAQFIPLDGDAVDSWFAEESFVEALETLQELHAAALDIDEGDAALKRISAIATVVDQTGALSPDATTRTRQTAVNAIANILTTGNGDRYSQDYRYYGANSNGWPEIEETRDTLRQAIDTLLETIEPEDQPIIEDLSTERNSSYYVLALARVYAAVEEAYDSAKADRDALDYSDLIAETITFLQEHDDARAAVQDQFDYVMVDEVQDTDPRQWRLVQALTGTDPRAFDSQNVFLVGDEKQSIYRFRGADVTAFSEARRRLTEANPAGTSAELPLTGNFRTVSPTLSFINDLFHEIFEPEGEQRQPYEAKPQRLSAERQKGTDIDGTCEYLLVPEESGAGLLSSDHPLETRQFINTAHREATALAARLSQLLADPPRVYDEDDGEYREACSSDITILLRARTRLSFYERALDEVGIPYTVVSGQGFYDTPEISALVNLFRVLEDPTDDIALYGVLRSPLFGFTDDRLARTLPKDEADSFWAALRTAEDELAAAYSLITDWRKAAGLGDDAESRMTMWSSLLTRVIDDTGYLASIGADDRPQQAVVNVEQLREKLRNWEDQRALTISGLLDRLDRQQQLSKRTPEATIHTDTEGIEIRTVHSAKGLESRIVVVPELNAGFNQRANVDEYGKTYLETVDGVPFVGIKAPTQADPFTKKDTLVRDRLKARHRRTDRAEQKRLLYVALTRARDHLIMSGTNKLAVVDDAVYPKGSDPSDASSWREYVEPALFENIDLDALIESQTLAGDLPSSEYHVRLPPEPTTVGSQTGQTPDTPLSIASSPPERQPQPAKVSATDYAKIVSGYTQAKAGEMFNPGEPGTALTADTEPEEQVTSATDTAEADSRGETDTDGDSLAAAFGDAVHRICELARPESEWEAIIEETYEMHEVDPERAAIDEITEHASHGLSAVEELHADLEDPLVYNELFVRASLPAGEVIGYIDHLVVTDEAYYILDFKTSNTTDRSPADIAERYWPQLQAYAVALAQQDTRDRDIHGLLYFTDAAQLERALFTPSDIGDSEAKISAILESEIAPQ